MPAVNLRRPGMCTMNLRRPPTHIAHLRPSGSFGSCIRADRNRAAQDRLAWCRPISQHMGALEGRHHTIIVFSVTSGGTQFDGTNFSSASPPTKS